MISIVKEFQIETVALAFGTFILLYESAFVPIYSLVRRTYLYLETFWWEFSFSFSVSFESRIISIAFSHEYINDFNAVILSICRFPPRSYIKSRSFNTQILMIRCIHTLCHLYILYTKYTYKQSCTQTHRHVDSK